MTEGQQDRRQYRRLGKSFRVVLRKFVFPVSEQEPVSLRCSNISAGGMLLETDARLFEQGDTVQATIQIPRLNKFHPGFFKVFQNDAEQNLVAVAEVVRMQQKVGGTGFELGIRFVDVYEDDWQALQKMIVNQQE